MDSLKNFLALGVDWHGVVPPPPRSSQPLQDAASATTLLGKRRFRIVLAHMAHRLRSDRPRAGLHLGRENLSDQLYGERLVSDVLAGLTRAGLVYRVRSGRKGCTHEDMAQTFFNPALFKLAEEWTAGCRALRAQGKRGAAAVQPRRRVEIPLVYPDLNGEQAPARAPEAQHAESAHHQHAEIADGCLTHARRPPAGGAGAIVLRASAAAPELAQVPAIKPGHWMPAQRGGP